jgi:hypothetical protein
MQGRDHWFEKWGSPEACLAYQRLINEYLASGRITPPQSTVAPVELVVRPTRRPFSYAFFFAMRNAPRSRTAL